MGVTVRRVFYIVKVGKSLWVKDISNIGRSDCTVYCTKDPDNAEHYHDMKGAKRVADDVDGVVYLVKTIAKRVK